MDSTLLFHNNPQGKGKLGNEAASPELFCIQLVFALPVMRFSVRGHWSRLTDI